MIRRIRRSQLEIVRGTGDERYHPYLSGRAVPTETSRDGAPGSSWTVRAKKIERPAPQDLFPDYRCNLANSRSYAGQQEIGSTDGLAWSKFGGLSIPLEFAVREQGRTERPMCGTEIIFEVTEDELDGGFSASALGFGIHTQGTTIDELHRNVREAVDCYFDEGMMTRPRLIRLHYARDEVLVA